MPRTLKNKRGPSKKKGGKRNVSSKKRIQTKKNQKKNLVNKKKRGGALTEFQKKALEREERMKNTNFNIDSLRNNNPNQPSQEELAGLAEESIAKAEEARNRANNIASIESMGNDKAPGSFDSYMNMADE